MKNVFVRVLACVLMAMLIFTASGITASCPDQIIGEAARTDEAGSASSYIGGKGIYNKNEWKVLALTNAHRLSMDIPPLTTFAGIQEACDLREKELTKVVSHTRPDGRSCFTAMSDVGVPYSGAGENIAAGQPTSEYVVNAWMNSPGHRSNMLDPSHTHMGVGYLNQSGGYRHYWVQLFCDYYYEETTAVTLEGADSLAVKRGTKISDMGIVLHAENSVYGDCVCPLIDEMCTGYKPNVMGEQTVTAHYDGFDVPFTVNVVDPVTSVTLNKSYAKVYLGKTLQLSAKIAPSTAPIRTLEWKSSDKSVATVDENGLVTSVGKGKCTITATAHSGVKATCTVDVALKTVTSIKLDATKYSVTLKNGDTLGDTFQLTATVKPKNASVKTLKWKSSNKKVATVDENGLVTIVGFGKCTITANATDGSKKSASCAVTVNKKSVTKITLTGENTMNVGETQTISAAVKPKKAFNQNLTWKSSKPEIATVDENGVVTAHKPGKVTITCVSQDNKKIKAKITIKIAG